MENRKNLIKSPKLDPQLAFDVRTLSLYIPLALVLWVIAGNWLPQYLAFPAALILTHRVYLLNRWFSRLYPPGYLREWMSWMAGPDRLVPGTPPRFPPLLRGADNPVDGRRHLN